MDWFIRLQAKPDDDRTRHDFARWRDAHVAHDEAFRRIERLMAMPSLHEASRRDAARLAKSPRPETRRSWTKYAAAMAAALLIVVGYLQYPALLLRWQADHMTAPGERKILTLPDGSLIELNTSSAVALDFAGGRRHLSLLAGEVFFDVKPDSAHPFTVTARFSETTVKGTAFSIRTGDDEDMILLAHGRVAVSRLADRSSMVEIDPGQFVTADAAAISEVRTAALDMALAWRDGRVVFREEAFAKALSELDRYYVGSVVIANEQLETMKISGSYRIDDPRTAILTLAAAIGAKEARFPGGLIILY